MHPGPPPFPIGVDFPRPDAAAKVRGEAAFVADLDVPGAWYGMAVRSPVVRGRLLGWARDPSFDFDRVVVVCAGDIPGDNVQALLVDDQPVLCDDRIEHWGEVLALVAAPDRELCREASDALRPRIDELPAELDPERSSHCFHEIRIDKGDVDAAFARGARVVEGTYRTDSQEQCYIEPQGIIAWPPDADGILRVAGSLQCPHYVQRALVRVVGAAASQCHVRPCATGGGFGGKEDYPSVLACQAALLALRSGRPVRMIYDRHEDLSVTPKRHPSRVRIRSAVDESGALLAHDIDVLLDGGAYATLSPVVLSRASIHAAGPYRCPNVQIRGRAVRTNRPPSGAFRGFGAPQTCFAIERQMDRIATELGVHPFELRRRNALRPGDRTATGQVLDDSCAALDVLESVERATGIARHPWRRTRSGDRIRRGRGMSLFFHGAGFTGSGEETLQGRVRVELTSSGRVAVRASSTEIGQGTEAMFVAIAAAALGVPCDQIDVVPPDTSEVPDSGPTVASRTCMIVGGCVERACRELTARVGGDAALPWDERARSFLGRGGDGSVTVTYASPPGLSWDDERCRGDAYPTYGWAADVADVEVDLDTFEVRVVDFVSAVDVGRAIQPRLVRGQVEGGSLQAIGFAHLEVVTSPAGRYLQDRLATCVIPTSLDAPSMRVEILERPFRHGPFGAKGVGELPMDGGAPAVVAAIEDALGIAIDHVPATPERLLASWLRAQGEEHA